MFLKHRSLQAEYFDEFDRPDAELVEGYRLLSRMNRLFMLAQLFQRFLPAWLGVEQCRNLSILDVGGGDGSLGVELSRWAREQGWYWQFTILDLNPKALRLGARNCRFVEGSALNLPFPDHAFDVVVSSQTAHHLPSEAAVARHFSEAWRVSRQLIFLNDLHRNVFLYTTLWLVLRLGRYPAHFRSDALLSVRRGWRLTEWKRLAVVAEIPDARVRLYAGARIMMWARKSGARA